MFITSGAYDINMTTKEELSIAINSSLGTDLDWSRMRKDDLEDLLEIIQGDKLLEKVVKLKAKEMSRGALEKQIDDWYPGKLAKRLL